jgi:hypothetical protein
MRQRVQVSSAPILGDGPPLTVQQAAAKLGQSEEWIRSRFERIPGTLMIPAPPRRGKRSYKRMLIPVGVFEGALRSWAVN